MILDKSNTFCSAQAVTASAASADIIDLGAARDIGMSAPLYVMITCSETALSAGATTVSFDLQTDDSAAFSSPAVRATTGAVGKASLTNGMEPIYIAIPPGTNEQFIRLFFTVATGPLTAGRFSASIVRGPQRNQAYPDAL